MERKKARAGASASAAGMMLADKQIGVLCDKILPQMPHILSVPTKTPYQPVFPHENQCTPFDSWEVMKLQYVTLISNADRGVGYAHGNWEDAINAKSPSNGDLPSSTSTPNPVRESRKIPAVKMSIADYKNLKSTGAKPAPRPSAVTPESRNDTHDRNPTNSRNTSYVSGNLPMARGPSFEGGDHRPNGVGANIKNARTQQLPPGREDPLAPRQKIPGTRDTEITRATVNGNAVRESLHTRDANKDPRSATKPIIKVVHPPLKHALPPRPQSPRRHQESRPQKRPLESGDASQPEKRAKVDHVDSRTPTSQSKPTTRKPDVNNAKPSPPKAQKSAHPTPSHQRSPLPKKVAPVNIKLVDTKTRSSKPSTAGRPELPPLLSPLPADFETPFQSFESLKKPEVSKSQPRTPSQNAKGIGSDTIVVKQPHSKKDTTSSSPLSTPPKSSPPFVLPRLLSPDLPDVIEAELLRLQQKSATLNSNSVGVEARHEKVRQPGAPGVAQKRPKIGHPPKKTHGESSGSIKKAAPEKLSLIVKLPYKKAAGKRIVSLLRLPARPTKEFKEREASKNNARGQSVSADEGSESEDIPLATSRATKAPLSAPNSSRKRPAESSDRKEPAPKRPKGPDNIDVAKASTPLAPPFKSPALNGPSLSKDFGLLSTPKKGDAMKSVAMRRVDSSDGHARTPQPTSTSTPASAEKPRTKLDKIIDQESLARARIDEAKFYPLGTTLKRKMQAMLAKEGVAEEEKKAGVMRGVESLMAYMLAFHLRDRIDIILGRALSSSSWEQFFPIWHFVEGNTRHYPELKTLLGQLGAVSREQLARIYLGTEEPKPWDKLTACLLARDKLWIAAKKDEKHLTNVGIHGMLGPWTTVHDAVGFGVATLSYYAYSQKMSWDGDSHFATAPAKQYMSKGERRIAPKETRIEREGVPDEVAALVG